MVTTSGVTTAKEMEKFIVLAFDEMKIKEGLVYDKHSGHLMGFVSLGNINGELQEFERRVNGKPAPPTIATHMLSFMIRGI